MTGVQMRQIAYKGSTDAHPDLTAGRVSMMFDTAAAALPRMMAGDLVGLAVTTSERSSAVPEMPTIKEAGVPGYSANTWGGILASAGTPLLVVEKLNAEINKAPASADVKTKLEGAAMIVQSGSPDHFADQIATEHEKWGAVIKGMGILPE